MPNSEGEAQALMPNAIGDEPADGQLLDHLRLDRRLELLVEALQRLLGREARHDDAHRLVLLLLRRDLLAKDVVKEVGIAHVLLGHLLKHHAQLGRHTVQTQALAGALKRSSCSARCDVIIGPPSSAITA